VKNDVHISSSHSDEQRWLFPGICTGAELETSSRGRFTSTFLRGVSGELLVGASYGEFLTHLSPLFSSNSFPDTSFTNIVETLPNKTNGKPS